MFEIVVGKLGKLFLREVNPTPVNFSVNASSPPHCPAMPGALPVLSAKELLSARREYVNRIEELASTTRPHFEQYYLSMLWRFAEWSQQLPASEVHHRAYPGGALDHGLGVAAAALRIRQGHLLPPGAPPEEAVLKKALWTYAIFTLALLHDAANPAVDLAVTVFGEDHSAWGWNPWSGGIGSNPNARWYKVGFHHHGVHRCQPCAGLMLAPYLVGGEGLAWLQSDPILFAHWLACASGDDAQAGVLGEIVNKAIGESVGRCSDSGQRIANDGNGGVEVGLFVKDKPEDAIATMPIPVQQGMEHRQEVLEGNEAGDIGQLLSDLDACANSVAMVEEAPSASQKRASAGGPGGKATANPLGREFLHWLMAGVQSGLIKYNRPESRVHVVREGVLLASPMIFRDYAEQMGSADYLSIQRSFIKLKLHQENTAGMNVCQYVFSGSNSVMTGFLIANPGIVFGTDVPVPNPLLSRR